MPTNSSAISSEIATKAAARRSSRLRSHSATRTGAEDGVSPIPARPARKNSPENSPTLSALSTTGAPVSRPASSAGTARMRKPDTSTTS